MNLTDRLSSEKDRISEWAREHTNKNIQKHIFYASDLVENSYYTDISVSNNISDYSLTTIPEFVNHLNNMWRDDDVMREVSIICAVAAFKGKNEENMDRISKSSENGEDRSIPDYIYVF